MYDIPGPLEEEIVRLLYKHAEEINWIYLPDSERTSQYNRWVDDAGIGGRLILHLKKAENVRVWIKDGPMKEYARAIYGVGKYAPSVSNPASGVTGLLAKALGAAWEPDMSTRKIKPLRVLARSANSEEEEVWFTWGPAKDLKHLIWAALRAEADGDPTPWVVCLVDSFVKPTPVEEKAAHLRIGQRCGLRIVHVTDG